MAAAEKCPSVSSMAGCLGSGPEILLSMEMKDWEMIQAGGSVAEAALCGEPHSWLWWCLSGSGVLSGTCSPDIDAAMLLESLFLSTLDSAD